MSINLRKLSDKAKATITHLENQIWRTRAYKRFFLNDHQNIRVEAIPFLKWMRHFCHVDRSVYKARPEGVIDPYATHVAAGRLEVYQELVRMLGMDERKLHEQINQLREQDYNP